MEAKIYCIWAVLIMGLFPAISFSAEGRREYGSLAGLQGVVVVVEEVNQEAKRYGLTSEELQTETEQQLRENGVRVFSAQEHLQTPEMPLLYVNVNVVVRADSKFAAANVYVALKQAVFLKRDPTEDCMATTWDAEEISTYKADELKDVREDLKALVDEFINVYLAANPQTAGRKDRDRVVAEPNRIEAVVGQDFVIALESNPSTGYSWRLASSLPDMLKLQDKKYIAAEPQLIGGGGAEEWTFRPVRSGKAIIAFEYVRPWEKEASPVKQRRFFIVVKKNSIGAVRP
jgi:inhibitor of cysteine peptidase